ncbi:MAG: hypothetical protein IJG84_20365 [Kiritimatiellae bacterium]|nr:hypothetical protein [Kiritimatiellia bacterium]
MKKRTESVCESLAAYVSLDGLILFNLLLSYLLFSIFHMCGCSFPRGSFLSATVICISLALLRGRKFAGWYVGVFLFCLLASCFTFSYIDSDAITVHYPCQALLAEGWNPIYERTADAVLQYGVDGSRWAFYIAFMPKVTAACGAMVAKTFGLFAGDSFLGYALCFSLFALSRRFASSVWPSCGSFARFIFAFGMVCSPQFVSVLSGKVDYTVHAAFVAACLSAALIWRGGSRRDCVVFLSSIVIAATCKALALVFSVYLMVCLGIVCRKSVAVRWLLFGAVVCILICGFSPFFTAWATQAGHDITEAFVVNDDGAKMGLVSRTVYAWFSKWLAIKGCAIAFAKFDFNPSLVCQGGGNLEGFGTLFRALMWMSILALALSKRTVAFWCAIFIFITSNLIPAKYIGYARYTPQMIIVPALAFFNFAYAPQEFTAKCSRLITTARVLVVAFIVVFHGAICLRTAAIGVRYIALEADRQQAIKEIKTHGPVGLPTQGNKYVLSKRLMAGGVQVVKDESAPRLPKMSMMMMIDMNDSEARQRTMDKRFPFCFRLKDFKEFHWGEVLTNFPRPVFRCGIEKD